MTDESDSWQSTTLALLGWSIVLVGPPLIAIAALSGASWHRPPLAIGVLVLVAMTIPAFRRRMNLRLRGVSCVVGLPLVATTIAYELGPAPRIAAGDGRGGDDGHARVALARARQEQRLPRRRHDAHAARPLDPDAHRAAGRHLARPG